MPPYKAPVSEAHRRKMFVLAREGKISEQDAIGKSRAVKGRELPKRVGSKRRSR